MCALIVHQAYARRLTGVAHEAAVSISYSELQQKNKSLEMAVTRLRDADRVKSNFLATMSHELRTPLTSVIGYSEMLLEGLAGALSEDQREYVQTILGKADQLLQLITSVLDMSRVEAHRTPVDETEVPLIDVVESVIGLSMQISAGATQIGDFLRAFVMDDSGKPDRAKVFGVDCGVNDVSLSTSR